MAVDFTEYNQYIANGGLSSNEQIDLRQVKFEGYEQIQPKEINYLMDNYSINTIPIDSTTAEEIINVLENSNKNDTNILSWKPLNKPSSSTNYYILDGQINSKHIYSNLYVLSFTLKRRYIIS